MSRRGFTLVELLIVLGIIAVLIGILMPTLGKARAQAREVQCGTLLRAWGQAFYHYAAIYKGKFPHSGDRSSNPTVYKEKSWRFGPENDCGWTDMLPPLMNRRAWFSYPLGQRPTGDIWNCPLAQPLDDAIYGAYEPSVTGYHTYLMNKWLDYNYGPGMPAGTPPYPLFLNAAKVRQPSVTLLMFEGTMTPGAANGQSATGSTSCTAGEYAHDDAGNFSERHAHMRGKLGGNTLMIDGHVEWTDRLWTQAFNDTRRPAPGDRTWLPY